MENYVGPNNPTNYNGSDNFSVRPSNHSDRNGMEHDLYYKRHGANGPTSVFFNPDVLPGDYTLIGNSFQVWIDPRIDASVKDRMEGFSIGVGIGAATLPKSGIYGLERLYDSISNGLSNTWNQLIQGVNSYNSSFARW
jgi:hypothetical protein